MRTMIVATVAALGIAGAASAASHMDRATASALKARQGLMQLYAMNLGKLGGMARGNMEFDAEVASKAATDLHNLAMVDQTGLWPEGSDNATLEGETVALPAIWEDMDGFQADIAALREAAAAMEAGVGDGLEGLQAAMGGLGGACGACHEDFRQSSN